ncbi:MAG: nickel-dependent lactate racemase [Lactimicrobium sp.]|jgi:nickel-dependent lactate racemase|uniref:nickel-dependent lactate racemase n=1 Tax=Lactimicrobium sp. TaxID=2563780 RepID=UPI002F35CC05
MKLQFGIGNGYEEVDVDERNLISVLQPGSLPSHPDEQKILLKALSHPIGTDRIQDIVHPGEKIAIITSDISRPCPSWKILSAVVKELTDAGIRDQDMTITFALGSHRKMTAQELEHLVGADVYHRIACRNSDPDDTVTVGTTSRGTKVEIDRTVMAADRRICLGNVEYHYFAGFSGGAKAIFPGCSTPASIAMNHRWMIDQDSYAGSLDDNPVRQDIEEAASLTGVDFIVNVVLNPDKEIVYAACGDVQKAHRDACRYLADSYACRIPHEADIVIVSQGGYPKDLNLYQLQKALDNARHAIRQGGTIILVGSAAEGFGNALFEKWMLSGKAPKQMLSDLHRNFVLGGHKAAAIARVREKADIYFVSQMDPSVVEKTMLKPYASLDKAYADALARYGDAASVIAMPYGGSTLPVTDPE